MKNKIYSDVKSWLQFFFNMLLNICDINLIMKTDWIQSYYINSELNLGLWYKKSSCSAFDEISENVKDLSR